MTNVMGFDKLNFFIYLEGEKECLIFSIFIFNFYTKKNNLLKFVFFYFSYLKNIIMHLSISNSKSMILQLICYSKSQFL